jgi:tRNA modification GTPase
MNIIEEAYFNPRQGLVVVQFVPFLCSGIGGIAVIGFRDLRLLLFAKNIFSANKNATIAEAKSHTLLFGEIRDENETIDEVVISIFRNPHSFTGEDVAEISCHGSVYVQQRILQLLISKGCSLAQPGEFTQRAFLNGKMDLSQAEAVADLIASASAPHIEWR